MADDLGWGDVGYNEAAYPVTPNLDHLARGGIIFDRFYSASPVCSPTRGSVLTGRHPYRYGVFYANVGHLPREEITIAELLQEVGYRTGFFGKWHLGTLTRDQLDANRGGREKFAGDFSPPAWHGFERVFATESKTPTYDPMLKPESRYQQTWWDPVADGEPVEEYGTRYWDERGETVVDNMRGDDTRIIMDRAIEFVTESRATGEPFLAIVWTHSPHLPVVSAFEDQALIDSDDPYTRNYYGSVVAMDREIGRLRDILKAQGIADNTLIWFMSDNGPEHLYDGAPGSKGLLRGAKRSLYEGGIRVPSVMWWRGGVSGGKVVEAPSVTSDILPTLLQLTGIAYPDERPIDGRSLVSYLLEDDEAAPSREIFFESAGRLAVIGKRYKLVYHPEESFETFDELRSGIVSITDWTDFSLYDLHADPAESTDISADNEDMVWEMAERLATWRASLAESREGADYD